MTAVAKQTITVEPKTLTVTPKVKDKVYDGKTSAAVTYTLNGVVNDDAVTVAPVTANFADANVGTKTVLLSVHWCCPVMVILIISWYSRQK